MASDGVVKVSFSLCFNCTTLNENGLLWMHVCNETYLPFVPAVGMSVSISDDKRIPRLKIVEVEWRDHEKKFDVMADADIEEVSASDFQYLAQTLYEWKVAEDRELGLGE